MCDQGKKDRANRNGTTRNGPAPASRGCHYLPVDCQNLKCYNGSASQVTHDGQSQKGVGKCNGVNNSESSSIKAYQEAIADLVCQIDNQEYLVRIYNLTQYLCSKS